MVRICLALAPPGWSQAAWRSMDKSGGLRDQVRRRDSHSSARWALRMLGCPCSSTCRGRRLQRPPLAQSHEFDLAESQLGRSLPPRSTTGSATAVGCRPTPRAVPACLGLLEGLWLIHASLDLIGPVRGPHRTRRDPGQPARTCSAGHRRGLATVTGSGWGSRRQGSRPGSMRRAVEWRTVAAGGRALAIQVAPPVRRWAVLSPLASGHQDGDVVFGLGPVHHTDGGRTYSGG